MRPGFDSEKYLEEQSHAILERAAKFGDKLYLEFGGKLICDFHAARILPGFDPNAKIKLLQKLKDKVDIIICIFAGDIEQRKMRADFGVAYDTDTMRTIDDLHDWGLEVRGVVVTRYQDQPAVRTFLNKLSRRGIKVYTHRPIQGYPTELDTIVSRKGYGANSYIETEKPIVIVTGPGPNSGKMATCLSQVYHEFQRGVKAGYAKFETFPVWNLPLQHPVNLAYEAATADLNDVNMIDPFHLEAYGKTTVNYNRDVEIFPVLSAIFERISGECPYKSPTDMGVNMAGYCIFDNDAVEEASRQEILRRYYHLMVDHRKGMIGSDAVYKVELLMKKAGITAEDRPVVAAALRRAEETGLPAAALELPDGQIVTGKTTSLLGSSAAVLLNALKVLGGIRHEMHLIAPIVIEPIQKLKTSHLGNHNPRLHTDEILIALSISAATNPTAALALQQLPKLRGCEVHTSVILSQVDEVIFKKLGINLTSEPQYQTKKLYHK